MSDDPNTSAAAASPPLPPPTPTAPITPATDEQQRAALEARDAAAEVGQHPYTDPPPMHRRRFAEDPVPLSDAGEQQVLQGRGNPAPYPTDDQGRAWQPDRYPDQAAMPRPLDTPQPSQAEAMGSGLTFAQFLAFPPDQQDRLLAEGRARQAGSPQAPMQATAAPSPGVTRMAPAYSGTALAGEACEGDEGDEAGRPASDQTPKP
jgi:hypothetical protein